LEAAQRPRYTSFLSYSHRDARVAERLHRRLESFRIDRDLVGQPTPMGTIPATLRPIFRDRAEFDAGGSLAAQTRTALAASASLIVLASPDAAKSHYVNEEVRLFRQLNPHRPVIPLIVAGPSHATDQDVFPPALRFLLDEQGTITATPADLLAADLRESGDGLHLACAKIVARLIGLTADQVFRRAERERRRQIRLRLAVASVIAVLALGGGVTAWHALRSDRSLAHANQEITDAKSLAAKLLGINPARADTPGALENLTQAITAISQNSATDARYARALELLKSGKTNEAATQLEAVAQQAKASAARDQKRAAAAYRNLGAIAGLADPKKARAAYAEAARLDPDDTAAVLVHGAFEYNAGNLAEAEAASRHLITISQPGRDDGALYWAQTELGDIHVARGNLNAASAEYEKARAIAIRLTNSDRNNASWQVDLLASDERVGDVLMEQGNLPAALQSYRDSLAIATRLAKSDPSYAYSQGDLAVSDARVGDVLKAQGNLSAALQSYRDSLAITTRAVELDPNNAIWQRDLSDRDNEIGNVLAAQGNLPGALQSYCDSLQIRDRLAKSDPSNADSQRDLAVSDENVGDVLVMQGNLQVALQYYSDSWAILDRLAKSDANNTGRQEDIAIWWEKIADLAQKLGNKGAARNAWRNGHEIMVRLTQLSPDNAQWKSDLAWFDSHKDMNTK
jgi:tetratricopeptide (TPR) repeat protein